MSEEGRFIGFIAMEIWKAFGGRFREAADQARQALSEFLEDEAIGFGHGSYSWDEGGAKDIAREYVTRFGEQS